MPEIFITVERPVKITFEEPEFEEKAIFSGGVKVGSESVRIKDGRHIWLEVGNQRKRDLRGAELIYPPSYNLTEAEFEICVKECKKQKVKLTAYCMVDATEYLLPAKAKK